MEPEVVARIILLQGQGDWQWHIGENEIHQRLGSTRI
jgi:hypothetical protein